MTDSLIECSSQLAVLRMTDRKIEMDAVRSAEFKEAFDEFDKVRGQLVDGGER